MFEQMSQMLYAYIMQCEVYLLRQYKVDSLSMMRSISMLDLHTYMDLIQKKEKEEYDSFKKKDIMTALKQICDILNFVFHVK